MRSTLGRQNMGLVAAFMLVLSGCVSLRPYDPGPGNRVAAAFVQDSYLSGQSVNVTISNLSEVTLFYPGGFCKAALQRREGSTWKTILPAPTGCAIASAFLDPGQTIVHQYRLPKDVALGTYRLTMPMPVADEDVASQAEFQTPAFQVYRASDQ